jgi:ectoine hydroxylase-related dioxygenase (phytanoyl-CoA dioxygenase family)
MDYTLSAGQREQYRRDGYIILRGIVHTEDVEALKADIRDLVERSAAGEGPEIRWINEEKRLPERLGLLLRPGWVRPSFVASLEQGPYFSIAEQILGTTVRYSLFGMLAGGDGKPYVQNWHRDLAPTEGENEVAVLERNYRIYTQINAPLFPDRYLTIVPGSHLRPTTAAEREVLARDPTGGTAERSEVVMPGQLTVETEPGDVAFYYSNLLHRGYNPGGALRWTMHHAFVNAAAPVAAHERGQERWIGQPGYLESLPPALGAYLQRYLDAVPAGEPTNIAEP